MANPSGVLNARRSGRTCSRIARFSDPSSGQDRPPQHGLPRRAACWASDRDLRAGFVIRATSSVTGRTGGRVESRSPESRRSRRPNLSGTLARAVFERAERRPRIVRRARVDAGLSAVVELVETGPGPHSSRNPCSTSWADPVRLRRVFHVKHEPRRPHPFLRHQIDGRGVVRGRVALVSAALGDSARMVGIS